MNYHQDPALGSSDAATISKSPPAPRYNPCQERHSATPPVNPSPSGSMPTAENHIECRVIFVIESTRSMKDHIATLWNAYMEPVLAELSAPRFAKIGFPRTSSANSPTDNVPVVVRVHARLQVGIVLYGSYQPRSQHTVIRVGMLDDAFNVPEYLENYEFSGGDVSKAAVAEGLVAALEILDKLQEDSLDEEARDVVQHCIIVGCSSPYKTRVRACMDQKYFGISTSGVCKEFRNKGIHLSLISPKSKVDDLENLLTTSNEASNEDMNSDFLGRAVENDEKKSIGSSRHCVRLVNIRLRSGAGYRKRGIECKSPDPPSQPHKRIKGLDGKALDLQVGGLNPAQPTSSNAAFRGSIGPLTKSQNDRRGSLVRDQEIPPTASQSVKQPGSTVCASNATSLLMTGPSTEGALSQSQSVSSITISAPLEGEDQNHAKANQHPAQAHTSLPVRAPSGPPSPGQVATCHGQQPHQTVTQPGLFSPLLGSHAGEVKSDILRRRITAAQTAPSGTSPGAQNSSVSATPSSTASLATSAAITTSPPASSVRIPAQNDFANAAELAPLESFPTTPTSPGATTSQLVRVGLTGSTKNLEVPEVHENVVISRDKGVNVAANESPQSLVATSVGSRTLPAQVQPPSPLEVVKVSLPQHMLSSRAVIPSPKRGNLNSSGPTPPSPPSRSVQGDIRARPGFQTVERPAMQGHPNEQVSIQPSPSVRVTQATAAQASVWGRGAMYHLTPPSSALWMGGIVWKHSDRSSRQESNECCFALAYPMSRRAPSEFSCAKWPANLVITGFRNYDSSLGSMIRDPRVLFMTFAPAAIMPDGVVTTAQANAMNLERLGQKLGGIKYAYISLSTNPREGIVLLDWHHRLVAWQTGPETMPSTTEAQNIGTGAIVTGGRPNVQQETPLVSSLTASVPRVTSNPGGKVHPATPTAANALAVHKQAGYDRIPAYAIQQGQIMQQFSTQNQESAQSPERALQTANTDPLRNPGRPPINPFSSMAQSMQQQYAGAVSVKNAFHPQKEGNPMGGYPIESGATAMFNGPGSSGPTASQVSAIVQAGSQIISQQPSHPVGAIAKPSGELKRQQGQDQQLLTTQVQANNPSAPTPLPISARMMILSEGRQPPGSTGSKHPTNLSADPGGAQLTRQAHIQMLQHGPKHSQQVVQLAGSELQRVQQQQVVDLSMEQPPQPLEHHSGAHSHLGQQQRPEGLQQRVTSSQAAHISRGPGPSVLPTPPALSMQLVPSSSAAQMRNYKTIQQQNPMLLSPSSVGSQDALQLQQSLAASAKSPAPQATMAPSFAAVNSHQTGLQFRPTNLQAQAGPQLGSLHHGQGRVASVTPHTPQQAQAPKTTRAKRRNRGTKRTAAAQSKTPTARGVQRSQATQPQSQNVQVPVQGLEFRPQETLRPQAHFENQNILQGTRVQQRVHTTQQTIVQQQKQRKMFENIIQQPSSAAPATHLQQQTLAGMMKNGQTAQVNPRILQAQAMRQQHSQAGQAHRPEMAQQTPAQATLMQNPTQVLQPASNGPLSPYVYQMFRQKRLQQQHHPQRQEHYLHQQQRQAHAQAVPSAGGRNQQVFFAQQQYLTNAEEITSPVPGGMIADGIPMAYQAQPPQHIQLRQQVHRAQQGTQPPNTSAFPPSGPPPGRLPPRNIGGHLR